MPQAIPVNLMPPKWAEKRASTWSRNMFTAHDWFTARAAVHCKVERSTKRTNGIHYLNK
ncbi:unnamed protein product [Ixodes pacificus]